MIIRLTAKLASKIKITPNEYIPASQNPLSDWSANLFTAYRRQYIIITNTTSLYSVVIPGAGIKSGTGFIDAFRNGLSAFFLDVGFGNLFEEMIEPELEHIDYSKSLNRSVTGSMNDLIYLAKVYINDSESLSFVSFSINSAPMSYLEYQSPDEMFRTIVNTG